MGDSMWQIGFWVITVLVVGSFSWSTFCAFKNESRIEKLNEKFMNLKEVSNDCLHKIDLRLSKIEIKLGCDADNDTRLN